MWSKLVCVLACVTAALAQTDSWVVQLEQGPVRGYKDAQGDIYQFLDVPYATAPTGPQKFKAPLPPPIWTEPFEAVKREIDCPKFLGISTQEDCLVANIYVPDTNKTNIPVLVIVHGGAYVRGAGYSNKFNSLVRTQKTVIVTFNYRLGAHGFLCLGTEDIPGNAAMKDQLALLRWVNKNIANFGGNPDDVTVSGCSAGGGSLDFLTLSPTTAGLFNKAIIGSGVVFGGTGTQTDPIEYAKKYARLLNFTNVDDLNALEEFYKTASHELLVSKLDVVLESIDTTLLFAPCVERDVGQEMFLADTPINILTNGNYHKIPLLYGFSQMEGLYRLPVFDVLKDKMNEKFSDFLPGDLYFENEAQKEEVAEKVKEFYFGSQDVSEETILGFIDFFTDIMFAYHMIKGANMRIASLGDTIYLYEYSFLDENTPIVLNTNIRGPTHCDQYVAVTDEEVTSASEEYKIMKETMREMWINFITTGDPAPAGSSLPPWPAMTRFAAPFMSLNATSRVEQAPLLENRFRFWDAIYEQHYKEPVRPSSAPTSTMPLIVLIAVLIIHYIV